MAATINLIVYARGILNSNLVEFGEQSAPYTLTTSADIKFEAEKTVAGTTTIEVVNMGAGNDLVTCTHLLFLPTVAGHLCWKGSSEANNSGAVLIANVPFILPSGNGLPYQNTVSNRIDETAEAITSVSFRNTTAGSGKIKCLGLG